MRANKLWRVVVEVECEDFDIEAVSKTDAEEEVRRMLEGGGHGLFVTRAVATEIPFVCPPGAERWAAAAAEIRFGGDEPRHAEGLGTWWWTNGHAALKCTGPAPEGSRRVGIDMNDVVGRYERREVTWAPPKPETADDHGGLRRVARQDKKIVVADDYLRLVERSSGSVTWKAAAGHDEPWHVPVLAFDGDELVAVVMGIRP